MNKDFVLLDRGFLFLIVEENSQLLIVKKIEDVDGGHHKIIAAEFLRTKLLTLRHY